MKSSICTGIDEAKRKEREEKRNAIKLLEEKKHRHKKIIYGIDETIKDLKKDLE